MMNRIALLESERERMSKRIKLTKRKAEEIIYVKIQNEEKLKMRQKRAEEAAREEEMQRFRISEINDQKKNKVNHKMLQIEEYIRAMAE